jgi:hypothetical protein
LSKTLSDALKGCDPACNRQVTRWYGPSIYNGWTANLNCQINALSKMSRLSKQKVNRNPPAPTSLENIAYITNKQGENMLLWDSNCTEELEDAVLCLDRLIM